jgi:hypothetical protein
MKVECDGVMRQCDVKCDAMLCVMRCDVMCDAKCDVMCDAKRCNVRCEVRSGEMSEVQSAKWVERNEMRMEMAPEGMLRPNVGGGVKRR